MSVYQPDCGNLVTALQTGTTRRVRQLLLAKHLFEQGGCLRCGIGADMLFLLTRFVEQAIEGLGTAGSAVTVFSEPICGTLGAPCFCAQAGRLMRIEITAIGQAIRRGEEKENRILSSSGQGGAEKFGRSVGPIPQDYKAAQGRVVS